jgi:hypothetical protein
MMEAMGLPCRPLHRGQEAYHILIHATHPPNIGVRSLRTSFVHFDGSQSRARKATAACSATVLDDTAMQGECQNHVL